MGMQGAHPGLWLLRENSLPCADSPLGGMKGDHCPWWGRGQGGGLRGHPSSAWSEDCTNRGVAVRLNSCSPHGRITDGTFGGTSDCAWAGRDLPALQAELLKP